MEMVKAATIGEGLAFSGDSPPDRRVMVERYLALAQTFGVKNLEIVRRPKREYYFENGVRLVRWVNQPPEPVPARRRKAS